MTEEQIRHRFLGNLDSRTRQQLLEFASRKRYAPGDLIFKEGQEADQLYLIEFGRIALETFAPAIGSVTVQTLGSGEALGWSWLFPPYTWQFSARAVDPTELIAFNAAQLRGRIEEDPTFGRDLVMGISKTLLQRLQATRMQLLDFYAPSI